MSKLHYVLCLGNRCRCNCKSVKKCRGRKGRKGKRGQKGDKGDPGNIGPRGLQGEHNQLGSSCFKGA